MTETTTRRWRLGFKRWLVLGLIVLSVFAARQYPPLRPHFQVPPEPLTAGPIFTIPLLNIPVVLTNTLVAVVFADLILFAIAFAVFLAVRSGSLVPRGVSGAIEGLMEAVYNLTETNAGKWTKTIFPFFATILLLVLVVNWTEVIPGVDSIGLLDEHHIPEEAECSIAPLFQIGETEVVGVSGETECAAGIVPFVRVSSTDLNFTLALALVSVAFTQVVGFRAQGLGYLTKYFNFRTLFKVPFLGAIDFFVGLIELLSETIKILSFSLRLFANILVGTLLLFVFSNLAPVFAPAGILVYNFLVGIIQAFVFGLLTMSFMSLATVGHHAEEGGEHH